VKILFLHPNIPDYVGDGLFHGLREILQNDILDIPRMDYMYADYDRNLWKGVANEGKVLYGHLKDNEDLKNRRAAWLSDIDSVEVVVISQPYGYGKSIVGLVSTLRKAGAWKKLVWVDGSDGTALFPYIHMRKGLKEWLAAFVWPMHHWLYFKREYAGPKNTAPLFFTAFTKKFRLQPISISIPASYIEKIKPDQKQTLFPKYIVDKEIAIATGARHGALAARNFLFSDEASYLEDIGQGRFGITTRRMGWDALRQYEYAAKGAVICFRNLQQKHEGCAPFGLNNSNCITYSNYASLQLILAALSENDYLSLQENSYAWIANHTTVAEAQRFLSAINSNQLYSA